MTNADLMNELTGLQNEELPTSEWILRTDFDEQMELDLLTGEYRFIHHVEGKYAGVFGQGYFSRLYYSASEHFIHPDDADAFRAMFDPNTMLQRLRQASVPGMLSGSIRVKSRTGQWIRTRQIILSGAEFGQPEHIVRIFIFDIQRQWEHVNGEPSSFSITGHLDDATGLLEGSEYFRALQERMGQMQDGWCLIYAAIEHHKLFTDWYGLDSGQYLLVKTAELLKECAEECGGLAGYLGEEYFCLTIPYDRERIDALYDELLRLIVDSAELEGFAPIFGIAMIDGSCYSIREYFNHAALTVEEISDERHTHIRIYDPALHKKNSLEYKLLCAFQPALEMGEITFWLQPQCSIPERKIVGAEALARWRGPEGEMISPSVFIPVLEKYGVVTKLDMYIWEEVCRWLRSWIDRGNSPVPISVNISRLDIFAIDVPVTLEKLVQKYGIPIRYLKVEVTESAYVDNTDAIRETVARLREMGFMVLMDDFGSGYSSLNMLRSLNMDVIKLDAQFLHLTGQHRKGVSILESIVNMTRNLATPIIVEGVENRDQLDFLSELGCRYVQGFYFYPPMPVEDFEVICHNSENIDDSGFIFKANQQLRVREFLDENIYSDGMLNNILGPVAFYGVKNGNVEIVRYNEQFFELVGIDLGAFRERKLHVQDYVHEADRERFFELFREAEIHPALGARGTVRTYRPNGALITLELHMYFIGEDEGGKRYYTSARDVTDRQLVSAELPGAYFRCTVDNEYEFLFISENFQKMTGFTEEEIRSRFDNKLIRMIHPEDTDRLHTDILAMSHGLIQRPEPYRVLRKWGDYIYLAEQCHVTDRFGTPCWESIVIDVTEVMHTRNQMRVLSMYMSDTILFLCRHGQALVYELAIHGLEKRIGMSGEEFVRSLNEGEFCQWIEGHQDIPHNEYTKLFIKMIEDTQKVLHVRLPNGRRIRLVARADKVGGDNSVEYIVNLRMLDLD